MGFRPSAKMVRLTPLRLLSAALVVALVFVASTAAPYAYAPRGYDTYTYPDTHPHATTASPDSSTDIRFGRDCSPFASGALRDVAFVLRLSAAHAPQALPAHVARFARCHQDLLVFSPRTLHHDDHDDDDHAHDVSAVDPLAHLRPEYRWGNADFDVYDRLHADNASDHANPDGRRLDKYTFLPMMEWAAYLRPDARWFVFVEPHTYLNHDNLYRFLARFNPRAAHYLGAPVAPTTTNKYKKTPYAHSGSGFILSRGALNKLMARGRMFAENHHFPGTHFFGENAADAPSGEQLLAHVLKKSGVPLRGYWPMFNDANPTTIRFGHDQWCDAVLTLHQLAPLDFSALARCDAARTHPERPLLFQHLFALIEPRLQPRLDDWTNLSDDTTYKPGTAQAKSFDACQKACLKDAKCLQYELSGGACALSRSVRLGVQRLPDGEQASTAGWMMERIAAFKGANSPCLGARFVHPRP
jgi:hypothetical protein